MKFMKRVDKVWGSELWLVNEPEYCGKHLRLRQGSFCSFHRHMVKKETFIVMEGAVRLEYDLDGSFVELRPMDYFTIDPGTWHRFIGIKDSLILEVSTHHQDSDVQRLTSSGTKSQNPPKPNGGKSATLMSSR